MLEIICVALAVYFESRGEELQGQKDVASVVWNRKNRPEWPNNACEVIKERNQFAVVFWPSDYTAWKTSIRVSVYTSTNPTTKGVFFATPGHHKQYKYLHTTGNHEFFDLN